MSLSFLIQRRLYAVFGGICSVAAVIVLVVAVKLPLETRKPEHGGNTSSNRFPKPMLAPKPVSQDPTLADFSNLWQKQLHAPLVDPPKVEKAETSAEPVVINALKVIEPPRLDVQLLGTMVDRTKDYAIAWLKFGQGRVKLVTEGDQISDIEGAPKVISIEHERVLLNVMGSEIVVELKMPDNAFLQSLRGG